MRRKKSHKNPLGKTTLKQGENNKYQPHQGKQEKERRRKRMKK